MSKILITGANGFIGSHVARKFLEKGHKVTGMVRETSDLSLIKDLDMELTYGDISDPGSMQDAYRGINIVIHAAGLSSDWGSFEQFDKVNVEGTKNVTIAAARGGVKRFVQISSAAIHGFGRRNMNENDPLPESNYHYVETKRRAEQFLFEFNKKVEMEITAIRPGNVFGPDDHTFIEKYLKAICKGKIAFVNGGSALTCPTYINNLVEVVWVAAFSPETPNEAFLVTDGLDITWKEFTKVLANALGVKTPSISFPFWFVYPLAAFSEGLFMLFRSKSPPLLTRYRIKNGGLDYHFDITKIRNVLGFNPRIKLDKAVMETVQWYKEIHDC